jgi:hypothetical protein
MAATTTKPAYTVLRKDEENERNLRKLFFAAAADIPDQMLSNLEQPFVRIALKLLELLRAHRAAHATGGAYVPPDDAEQDNWMQTDSDLVEAVDDDRPFIVLTETKFSFHCIPVGIGTLLTGLGLKKKTHVMML